MIAKIFILSTFCIFMVWNVQVNAITVSCEFQEIEGPDVQEITYTCMVTNSNDFRGKHVKIDGASGQHKDGRTNADVKGILFEGALHLEAFPTNLENVFGSLTVMACVQCSLTSISSENLKPFKDLKAFAIIANQIKSISGDTFDHNPQLEVVAMQFNQISNIDPQTFSKLDKLSNLYLSNNACKFLNDAMNRAEVEKMVKRIEKSECSSKNDFEVIADEKSEESFFFDDNFIHNDIDIID